MPPPHSLLLPGPLHRLLLILRTIAHIATVNLTQRPRPHQLLPHRRPVTGIALTATANRTPHLPRPVLLILRPPVVVTAAATTVMQTPNPSHPSPTHAITESEGMDTVKNRQQHTRQNHRDLLARQTAPPDTQIAPLAPKLIVLTFLASLMVAICGKDKDGVEMWKSVYGGLDRVGKVAKREIGGRELE
ncbi:hypothetical protein BJ508DRAFT_327741 [Ascobolus immersus RN42]|uniref:Uncharacterized protein n=1 Tax=Ascobolus immersus RN42 TaxID=1160509 RepID=A0A3N4I3V7_ASCIM|nr:hypothetical protein BJ508DRAFT_327741 [Ascobolus immersus RN42]